MRGEFLRPFRRRGRANARPEPVICSSPGREHEERRPNTTLKHFGAILFLLLLAFVAALSWQAWHQEESDTKAELATISQVGARALDSYLGQLEISLKILAEALADQHDQGEMVKVDRARELVAQFHRLHTELVNVVVARADGQILVSANAAGAILPSIAEEESFKNFSRVVFFGIDIGQAMVDPDTGRWIVPVRYRINDSYQNLLYVVSAQVPVDFFASFWKETPITSKAAIGLLRDDGYLLSRYPPSDGMREDQAYGMPLGDVLVDLLRQNGFPTEGVFKGRSAFDGARRLYVTRRLAQHPLTLFVSMPVAQIRNAWWRKVEFSYFLTLIVLLGGTSIYIITSRRQKTYEQSLDDALLAAERASRELDVALDNMSHGLCMFDAAQRLVVANDRYVEMYGLPPDAVRPGTPLTDLIKRLIDMGMVPRDQSDQMAQFAADMAAGKVDQRIREHPDGRTIIVTNRPLAGGGWVATHEDITERRRAEQKLEQTQRFLNAVIEHTPAILSVKHVRTRTYALVNRAASLLFGYASEQMIGRTVHELFGKQQADYFAARDDEAIATRGQPIVHEHTVTGPHNGTRTLSTTKLAILDAHGHPEYLISFSEDITERRRAEASIAYMAHHDPLTGLANRLLLRERMEEALRSDQARLAVLYLDLDHFKSINDTLGHSVGDEFLKVIASRLTRSIREGDTVARLGGDEFVVLLAQVADRSEVEATARRVREAITAPIELEQQNIVADVSIGISMAPNDAVSAEQLLKNSDMALYSAKADGRGTHRFFEPSMDADAQVRRTLEVDLRKALAEGEFELHFQPQVDIASDEIVACEALLRWNHRTRGMIGPNEFIPIAEDTGLITSIGEWVLRAACIQAASWPSNIKIAVNVSPAQFRSSGLLQTVVSALAAANLSPSRLEIEITEAVLLHNNETTLATLAQLDELGVRIALDDFGTGYSSLSYLRNFPFDKIKIDKSFIRDLTENSDSSSIVRAIAGLATELSMTTTAEGVETAEQLMRLREFGCTEMQGFLFSPPLPADDLAAKFFTIHPASARPTQAA